MLCLSYAFYFTTIAIVTTNTRNPLVWNVVFVFLLLMAVIVQKYVIRASSVINAMSTFNADVVGRVIEEQVDIQDKLINFCIIYYMIILLIQF
jgi:hypothetical protein